MLFHLLRSIRRGSHRFYIEKLDKDYLILTCTRCLESHRFNFINYRVKRTLVYVAPFDQMEKLLSTPCRKVWFPIIRRFVTYLKFLISQYRFSSLLSEQEIQERLTVCKACTRYNPNMGWCSVCLCRVNHERNHFNKLAFKESSCPLGFWTRKG